MADLVLSDGRKDLLVSLIIELEHRAVRARTALRDHESDSYFTEQRRADMAFDAILATVYGPYASRRVVPIESLAPEEEAK